ncbi:GrpB family protein [Domibacillus indicus]|uniref:GrpB family protein n=1 Tax=Domibacillus indicus TaxID=1437523 RepID=UPI00288A22A9|nr:GrpB family protein [Domibacillus indicus]
MFVSDRMALLFETETEKLSIILKDELMETFHIGSTAVPDLKAKPIIDMMPIVKDISKVDTLNEAMVEAGYDP